MAHAVVDHFEAVKIQKQNCEQGVLTPLCVFDEPPKPVYEKQPVSQPSQGIGYLSFGDVGLRAGHSQGFSRIVEYSEPPMQHPPKRSIFVEPPVLAVEVRSRAIAMVGYRFFHSFSI